MNEQLKQNWANHTSDAFRLKEGVPDMIVRVMAVARLLMTDRAALDEPSAEQTLEGGKKHKNTNLQYIDNR
jgi:hypothetical protein